MGRSQLQHEQDSFLGCGLSRFCSQACASDLVDALDPACEAAGQTVQRTETHRDCLAKSGFHDEPAVGPRAISIVLSATGQGASSIAWRKLGAIQPG
jgi:hypothetical protein